jgi:hypothetical protein
MTVSITERTWGTELNGVDEMVAGVDLCGGELRSMARSATP